MATTSRTTQRILSLSTTTPTLLPRKPYICPRCLTRPRTYATKPVSSKTAAPPPNKRNLNLRNRAAAAAPVTHDRGPASKEDTQTDFAAMNVLGNTPPPATGIDATTSDGFAFSNNLRVSGCGVLLLGGEVYRWRPWSGTSASSSSTDGPSAPGTAVRGTLLNSSAQFEPRLGVWSLLDVVWPKPDLLIIGTGPGIVPLSPATRRYINDLGIRIEVQDTRNAASQYNLLATERGIGQVAAALVPVGFVEERR